MLVRGNNRDRWLLSYADFITLLFAVFVLMYATAKAKERGGPMHAPGAETNRPAKYHPPDSNLLTDLRQTLKPEQDSGVVTVSTEQRGVVIALDDKLCFKPGQAQIETTAVPMFQKVADVLARHSNRILLQGHTDSVPIHNGQFRSNWELSTARSMAVLELMEQRPELVPQRFMIAGSADNAPVTSNDTEQGRAHNRRVEIIALDAAPGSDEHPVAFASR